MREKIFGIKALLNLCTNPSLYWEYVHHRRYLHFITSNYVHELIICCQGKLFSDFHSKKAIYTSISFNFIWFSEAFKLKSEFEGFPFDYNLKIVYWKWLKRNLRVGSEIFSRNRNCFWWDGIFGARKILWFSFEFSY